MNTMEVEHQKIAEKAKRLVDTCCERSLKHDDNVPAYLCHVLFECGLEDEYDYLKLKRCSYNASGAWRDDSGFFHSELPCFSVAISNINMTANRRFGVLSNEVEQSVQRCLREYSELFQHDTTYGLYTSEGCWMRGAHLLADFYSDHRKWYYVNKQFGENCINFIPISLTLNLEDSLDVVFLKNSMSETVYKIWKHDPTVRWVIQWPDIFSAIAKAAIPLTKLPPTDLQGAQWFMKQTTVDFGNLPAITPELLRNAVRDGRLKNWKSSEKPNANNLYSIQEVKDLYKEHAHLIPTD